MNWNPFLLLQSISGKIQLTVFLSLFCCAMIYATIQYNVRKFHLYDNVLVELETVVSVSQERISHSIENEEFKEVEKELASMREITSIEYGVVVDRNEYIVFSLDQEILRKKASSQLRQFDHEVFQKVIKENIEMVKRDLVNEYFYAFFPIAIKKSDLNKDVGLLFVQWSLSDQLALLRKSIFSSFLLAIFFIVLIMTILQLVLNRIIRRPMKQALMLLNSHEMGKKIEIGIRSTDELGQLFGVIERLNEECESFVKNRRDQKKRWMFSLGITGDAIQDWHILSNECFFSEQMNALLNLDQGHQLSWNDWKGTIKEDDWSILEKKMQRQMQGFSDVCQAEYSINLGKGNVRYILMKGQVVERNELNEEAIRFIAVHTDITIQRNMDDALRESEEHYRRLFEMAQEGIWLLNENKRTLLVNGAMATMLGYLKEEMIAKNLFDFVSPHARKKVESFFEHRSQDVESRQDIEFVSKTGRRVLTTMKTSPLYDKFGMYIGMIVGVMDITERKIAEEKIRKQALYDDLTKLPNRRMLNERLQQEFSRAVRHQYWGALFFIDLDHFKNVNDSLGHPVGDALLVAIATRLRRILREEDVLARLGGDEFVVLAMDLGVDMELASENTKNIAEKIKNGMNESFDVSGYTLNTSCSIGIAMYPFEQESIHDVLKQADAAMYRAKDEGRNAICLFNKEMHESIAQNMKLQMLLPGALEDEQFSLYFQPQVNHKKELIGAEVLLRWQEPDMGFVRPDWFIRAAEESGMIIPLGDWVLRQACEQLRIWQKYGLPSTFKKLSINISARQFAMDDFAKRVEKFVSNSGVDNDLIELEITESMLLSKLDQIVDKMKVLNSMGFYISLDDFGTGYSSLAYLRHLPLNKLKIDQAFVRHLSHNKNDRAIVETIIAMADHLEMEVIAEGVETNEQLLFLKSHGCYQYQGYFFDKPLPADEFFQRWIRMS